jgi:hypothetical protein
VTRPPHALPHIREQRTDGRLLQGEKMKIKVIILVLSIVVIACCLLLFREPELLFTGQTTRVSNKYLREFCKISIRDHWKVLHVVNVLYHDGVAVMAVIEFPHDELEDFWTLTQLEHVESINETSDSRKDCRLFYVYYRGKPWWPTTLPNNYEFREYPPTVSIDGKLINADKFYKQILVDTTGETYIAYLQCSQF